MSTLDFDEVRETANTSINTNMKLNINADTNTITNTKANSLLVAKMNEKTIGLSDLPKYLKTEAGANKCNSMGLTCSKCWWGGSGENPC